MSSESHMQRSHDAAQSLARGLADGMADAGIGVVCSLPETWLAALLQVLDDDVRFTNIHVAREEEGVGILAGAYLAGRPGALLMSNSGFMTCACALNGLAARSGIPMLLFIVQRGELGESQVLQGNVAHATVGMLDALGIRHFRLEVPEDVAMVGRAVQLANILRQPVALLVSRDVLIGHGSSPYWFRAHSQAAGAPADADAGGTPR
jgi:sulfopyruvate decarboxylase subunit alpha